MYISQTLLIQSILLPAILSYLNMTQMSLIILVLVGLMSSTLASFNPHEPTIIRSDIFHAGHGDVDVDQTDDLLRDDRPSHPMSTKARNGRETNSVQGQFTN